ncbi:maleylpyruvate isomerase N-terminal domain-containing protein [Micromonospora rubida]|uniref:Maleylpyruvate isomerase N-terminal domain-containing protein n=1 Tax=Micromonospora rubida TaxID=2697657 RepID=A0ABW7SM42_9ACTN
MTQTVGAPVRAATDAMLDALGPHTGQDWTVPAGTLDWSCWATAAHVAHDLLAYAGQVAGRPSGSYLPFDLTVSLAATPAEVLTVAATCGGLLATALDAADPGLRAWHFGPCDPAGFAAMGVAEILLHTHDVAWGLGVAWQLPDRLAAVALDRLFPEAPPGPPARVLLWMAGRAEFDGRPRRTSWTWRAALP